MLASHWLAEMKSSEITTAALLFLGVLQQLIRVGLMCCRSSFVLTHLRNCFYLQVAALFAHILPGMSRKAGVGAHALLPSVSHNSSSIYFPSEHLHHCIHEKKQCFCKV